MSCGFVKRKGLGFLAGCADLGIWADGMVTLEVLTDSSAREICQRTGFGEIPGLVREVEFRCLPVALCVSGMRVVARRWVIVSRDV